MSSCPSPPATAPAQNSAHRTPAHLPHPPPWDKDRRPDNRRKSSNPQRTRSSYSNPDASHPCRRESIAPPPKSRTSPPPRSPPADTPTDSAPPPTTHSVGSAHQGTHTGPNYTPPHNKAHPLLRYSPVSAKAAPPDTARSPHPSARPRSPKNPRHAPLPAAPKSAPCRSLPPPAFPDNPQRKTADPSATAHPASRQTDSGETPLSPTKNNSAHPDSCSAKTQMLTRATHRSRSSSPQQSARRSPSHIPEHRCPSPRSAPQSNRAPAQSPRPCSRLPAHPPRSRES